MANLNEKDCGGRPEPTPASGASAADVDIQQMNLDQVMSMVRHEVEQRKPQSPEGAAGAASGDARVRSERSVASTSPATSRATPDGSGTGSTAEATSPVLSTDEIMRRVRAEVRRRRGESGAQDAKDVPPADDAGTSTPGTAYQPAGLPQREPAIHPLPLKPEYSLHELLQFSDAAFVDTVYRVILRRPADPEGRAHYLWALRNGLASKTEVLGLIRFSEEGRHRGVHIDGLLLRFKLQRWRHLPVFGRCLGFASAVFRLPGLATRMQAIEGNAARNNQALERFADLNNNAIAANFDGIKQAIMPLRAQVDELRAALHAHQREQRDHDQALEARMAEQKSTLVRLREDAGTVHDETRGKIEALTGNLGKHEAAIAQLGEESVTARAKNEADLKVLAQSLTQQLTRQESVISDLGERLGTSQTTSEERIKDLMGRLEEQLLTIAHLAGDVGAFREGGEAARQELKTNLAQTALQIAAVQEHLRNALDERRAAHVELQQRLDASITQLQALDESLRAQRDDYGHQHHEIVNHLGAHDAMIKNLSMEGQRAQHGALEIQRQLIALLDRNLSPGSAPPDAQPATSDGDKVLAPQYVAFEDAFRGARDDIKQRVAPYLDTLESAGLGPDSGLVLDLGCGRGEWLEVLTAKGYSCRGVDLNGAMVADSSALGLDVVEGDAVGYLRGVPDASVAAITAMHIVEHIPHNTLIRLLDQAWRALIPGGVLILETPNPENLTVGACLFYLDPTHRNPIPPALLQWTVKERGFDEATIERLTAHRGNAPITHVAADVPAATQINQIIDWFTAAPDYAIVAKKPASAKSAARKPADGSKRNKGPTKDA